MSIAQPYMIYYINNQINLHEVHNKIKIQKLYSASS